MHRMLILAAVLGLGVNVADAQAPMEPQKSPKEVVEQFYKIETQGRWVGPDHWDELEDYFYDIPPWHPADTISVLQSYRVGDPQKQIDEVQKKDFYDVEVNYSDWGTLDPFLHFTPGQILRNDPPIEHTEKAVLYLTDWTVREGPSGSDNRENEPLRWRMYQLPSPALDVEGAIRYVSEMRAKSNDPAMKYNADTTLAILSGIFAGKPEPLTPAGPAPGTSARIAREFLHLESVSTPDQWSRLAKYFVETPNPQWDKVHIVDIVDDGADDAKDDIDWDKAEYELSTNSLGDLDSSLRLSKYPSVRTPLVIPSASACYGDDRFGFMLLLSDRHWESGTDGSVKEIDGPFAWKIQDTSFEPLITLDTAIRYVSQARDKTTNPIIKMNAARTLAILKFYKNKSGKDLPDKLSADAAGFCP